MKRRDALKAAAAKAAAAGSLLAATPAALARAQEFTQTLRVVVPNSPLTNSVWLDSVDLG